MLPIKSEIKSVKVSYIETSSRIIKIPSFKIPVYYIKVSGLFILLGLLFLVLTSISSQPTIEQRNLAVECTDTCFTTVMASIEPIKSKIIPITEIIKDKKVLDFICHNRVLERAHNVQKNTGLSVATIIGQKGVESNWNRSSLCKKTKNYGNIKCFKKHNHVKQGCVKAYDKIEKSNDWYVKAYTNWQGWSIYTNLIYKRYMKAASQTDIKDQLIWLKKKGYATDKNYVFTIWNVIKKYNLLELQRYIDQGYTITTSSGKFILLDQR